MREAMLFLARIAKYVIVNTKCLLYLFVSKRIKNQGLDGISTVVFSHDLGGGTEEYSKINFANEKYIVFKKISYRSDFAFAITYDNCVSYTTKNGMLKLVDGLKLDRVLVNSLVTYDDITFINDIVERTKCDLEYFVHDFHAVCKSYNLVFKNKYCALNCGNCVFYKKAEIAQWRDSWRKILSKASRVLCFSESSKDIFLNTYPFLEHVIEVRPHDMSYCQFTKMDFDYSRTVVGIVGNCSSIPKGKVVSRDFLKAIKHTRKMTIKIIGKTPFFPKISSKNIDYLGPYKNNDLQELFSRQGINVALFPSICPETFSYLISELIMLDIPIVSVNIGAQGEKLSLYHKAILVDSYSPESILSAIENYVDRVNKQ
jgi:hypothetical protein